MAQGDEVHPVHYSFSATVTGSYRSTSWSETFNPTWNELFAAIAPLMIEEATEPAIKKALDSLAQSMNSEGLRAEKNLITNC